MRRCKSLLKGLSKLDVNINQIQLDLQANWVVIAEGIQTILKRDGIEDGYEQIKNLTRKHDAKYTDLLEMIEGIDLPETTKNQLRELKLENYLGQFSSI